MGRINGIKDTGKYINNYSSSVSRIENRTNKSNRGNINSNIGKMKNAYPISGSGYFGEKGSSSKVRVIKSKDPIKTANDFFSKISKGGTKLKNDKNFKISSLSDGSIITMRISTKTSRKGKSPAVDINVKKSNIKTTVKNQKIHIEEE
jgi:hypothetical protein